MPSLGHKSSELFKKIIQICYWHLFLPHSSSHDITFENYTSRTNTFFPEYRRLMATYRDLLKEIPYTVRLENPEHYNTYSSGIAAFIKLISGEGKDESLAPIFKLARLAGVTQDESYQHWSFLLQLCCAHSNVFEGKVDIVIPTEQDIYNIAAPYRRVGDETVVVDQDRNEKNLPPFWKWYVTLIHPNVITLDLSEDVISEFLASLFSACHLQFSPYDEKGLSMSLPFPNIVYMKSMLRKVAPPREGKPDSAVRLYSAIQFVTFGISRINVIGADSDDVPDSISKYTSFLKSSVSDEAKTVVRYNIADLDRSQVVGALESFHLARSEAIKQSVIPEGEDDPSLDPDRHDPEDDDNLDPDIDRIGQTDVGLEESNPFSTDDDNNDDDNSDDSNNDDEETPSDGADDSDGGNSTNDSPDGSSDSGVLGDSPTDGAKSDNPSTDGKEDKDKEVSSKNTASRKAYKAIWGDNPLVLANDSDVEGYLYRSQVCRLNRRLQQDPGDAIPKNVKNTLNEWCKFWVHSTDVRSSISLIKNLGLTRYLKV